jgi:arylsulfatase A-like enzyme
MRPLPKFSNIPLLAAAIIIASAGIDVAIASAPGRGWLLSDTLTLFLISMVATLPFLAPWLIVKKITGERTGALMLATVTALHVGIGFRFGPFVNHPLTSPVVIMTVCGVSLVSLGAAWRFGAQLHAKLQQSHLVLLSLGLLGLCVGFLRLDTAPIANDVEGPNILLFTWDTTRADHLSPYGHSVDTPNLQALADRGVTFENAVTAAPQTGPAHLTILSGRYPTSHGVVANGTNIGPQPAMVANTLQAAGYQTGGFVAAFPVHERFSFGQGFDVFDSDFSPIVGLHELAPIRAFDAVILRNLPRERRGDQVNTRAIRWLNSVDDSRAPIFSWIHYYDPHGPYTPPNEYNEMYTDGDPSTAGDPLALPHFWSPDQRAITDTDYLTAQYDAEIAWTDKLFGEVVDAINTKTRDTVIIVTADHGESLTEHGVLFDHGDDLYDPSLLIPLIISAPGVTPGTRIACQTPSVRIAPTILELAGYADDINRDGESLVNVLMGKPCIETDAFASTVSERIPNPPVDHALRRRDFKFIDKERKNDELYNLQQDQKEQHNLHDTADNAAISAALKAVLDQRRAGSTAPIAAEMSDDVINMLRDLGYVE